jgi:TolB-like protein
MPELEFCIGRYRLQPFRQLSAESGPVKIEPKALNVLSVLAQARGELVTKDELLQAVWPDIFVGENVIQVHICKLRKLLGDDGENLVTVHGLGYRLESISTDEGPNQAEVQLSSVAVLPFANMSKITALNELGDGIAEELIISLCQIDNLQVPAHSSSFAYRDQNVDARRIGRELDVASILEGSIRCSGDHIRVSAQLIDTESGYHLWSQNFNRVADDPLKMETELAQSITTELQNLLGPCVDVKL